VELQTAKGICPTCHQDIKDTLLPRAKAASPMSLEDNMEFIRDQIKTFKEMLDDAEDVIEAKESDVEAIINRIKELNAQIRALKRTLKSDGRIPSIAAVQERLQLEARLAVVKLAAEKFAEMMDRFGSLAKHWSEVQGRLKTLADVNLSQDDERKLKNLDTSFVAQLREYGFSSFPIPEISIGRESYRPSREGYDIGLTSASAAIRMAALAFLSRLPKLTVGSEATNTVAVNDSPSPTGVREVGKRQNALDATFTGVLLVGAGAGLSLCCLPAGVLVMLMGVFGPLQMLAAGSLEGPCPYCGQLVTVTGDAVGADCRACRKRFVVRDRNYLRVDPAP
jgi:hypothetical protein